MGHRKPQAKDKEIPIWMAAWSEVGHGPLALLAEMVHVDARPDPPLEAGSWACVSSRGVLRINPKQRGTRPEWVWVLSHCLLHLGFGHMEPDCPPDPLWNLACDLVVAHFLQEGRIGTPPACVPVTLPFPVRSEEQVLERLHGGARVEGSFSTRIPGKPDMIREPRPSWLSSVDYTALLARSLQQDLQNSLCAVRNLPSMPVRTPWGEAHRWFLTSWPLLGALAASFQLVDDLPAVQRMGISTAAVCPQMKEIYVNSTWNLDIGEWRFVLAHEFLHAALRHDLRCEDRDPELWNVACDYVINRWLTEMHVGTPPEGVLLDSRFDGMFAEAVYQTILYNIKEYRTDGSGDLRYGDPQFWDRLEGAELDAWYRSALQQGLLHHQEAGRGLLPAGLIEEIRACSRPPIPWDVELARWFDERFRPLEPRRSYARLSRRQSAAPDIPRPAWYRQEEDRADRMFGVVLDTSGSMDRSLLAAALGSIASYSQARDVSRVRVVFCDAAAWDQGYMDPADIAGTVEVRGRGGTALQPAIDLLDRDPGFPARAPLLIITDGLCDRLRPGGRDHAFLIPWGRRLPFPPRGPVFRLR